MCFKIIIGISYLGMQNKSVFIFQGNIIDQI